MARYLVFVYDPERDPWDGIEIMATDKQIAAAVAALRAVIAEQGMEWPDHDGVTADGEWSNDDLNRMVDAVLKAIE